MRTAVWVWLTCLFIAVPVSAELQLDLADGADVAATGTPREAGGAVMRAGGGQGGTSMHWMAFNGDAAGITQQIVSGAEINRRLKTGGTPLHLAAYRGHVDVVRLLLEHGAKVNARTRAGVTPLDWAQRNGHEEVARLLKEYGAKPGKGKTPRTAAAGSPGAAANGAADPVTSTRAPKKFSLMGLPPEQSVVVVRQTLPEQKPEPKPEPERQSKPASMPGPAVAPGSEKRPLASYRIQLGAFGTEQRAVKAWSLFQKKHPEQLGGRKLLLDHAEVKGKTFYRVQAGPMERSEAWEVCGHLKQAGQTCAVMKRSGP